MGAGVDMFFNLSISYFKLTYWSLVNIIGGSTICIRSIIGGSTGFGNGLWPAMQHSFPASRFFIRVWPVVNFWVIAIAH